MRIHSLIGGVGLLTLLIIVVKIALIGWLIVAAISAGPQGIAEGIGNFVGTLVKSFSQSSQ